jgi:hypothetical protein
MTLQATLAAAQSEEDVKDAYVKALGLKALSKGLIDIRTQEFWFEAKLAPTPPAAMFAQLLSYVRVAIKKGDDIPPFLAVLDCEKAALMETRNALPLFKDKAIAWSTAASQISTATIKQIQPYIETHFVVYRIDTHENEFIEAVKTAVREGQFIRTQITPDNLKQVFDKWVVMIGRELIGVAEADYALIFFADIMHDGKNKVLESLPVRLAYDSETPFFILANQLGEKNCHLASVTGYRRFWAIYQRPPEAEHRQYLLERRDSLLPIDERSFKGAYYTPLKVVDKAYDLLAKTLGKNWQQKYIVWDMCCGVGNLEVKHSNHRNVFMSTLDAADLSVMEAAQTCIAATKFQYDYLNDDIDDFGIIDYDISKKLPKTLRQAIAENKLKKKDAKQFLILMNPPYVEVTSGWNTVSGAQSESKSGVTKTSFAASAMNEYGKASNELFTQFVARIHKEIPGAILAMFSTLKYINAATLETFRAAWKAKYLGGFVVHSKAFDGLNGDFPIGFLIWDTSKKRNIEMIETSVLDKNAQWIGEKQFYNISNAQFLTDWIHRPAVNNTETVPLKNAFTPATASKDLRGLKWSSDAIAWLNCAGNDIQNAGQKTMLFSSGYGSGRGFFVNGNNFLLASIVFSVRLLVPHKWVNHNDQFLQPTGRLSHYFKHDCLIWMLFHGKNLTASANDLSWNEQTWSIVNHLIPFTEAQVKAKGRFESSFMSDYLQDKALSKEAKAVLNEGLVLWQAYFASTDERKVRDELKLNRPDVGWYQIRKALEARNAAGAGVATDFTPFKTAYETLSDKLRPMVYELGFLK